MSYSMNDEMTLAVRDLVGGGLVPAYYRNGAAPFVDIAEWHIEQAVKTAVEEARRAWRHSPRPTRYRFVGRRDGILVWESTTQLGSRVEEIRCHPAHFWRHARSAPSPTSQSVASATNDTGPTQAVGDGGLIAEATTSPRSGPSLSGVAGTGGWL